MSLRNFISEHVILPLSDFIKGESVYKYFRFLQSTEHWSREQIDDYQNERLRNLIRYASTNVPYYIDLFAKLGLKADDIKTKADLVKIPIVNKSIMKKEGIGRFTSKNYPKSKMIYGRSSGSTGEPFSFYTTKEASSFNTAAKLRTWYHSGYKLGDRYMKISRNPRNSTIKLLQDMANNCKYIPMDGFKDEDLDYVLKVIEKEMPLFIRSYPLSMYLLAKRRIASGQYHFLPKHIMTTGSCLPDAYRYTIEKAFGCSIIDSYSCEGTANVEECANHACYHVAEEYGIIEIIDCNNLPINNGIGHVVSTDLWNYAHPFIRYDTQDLVEISSAGCSCSNQHQKIDKILGRECETFVKSDGRYFIVNDFVGFFSEYDTPIKEFIEAYQIVKKKNGSISFRLVVNNQYNEDIENYIVDYWSKQLKTLVSVELVDEIPIMQNNKRRTIVEEI